jgi:hypothetical protein
MPCLRRTEHAGQTPGCAGHQKPQVDLSGLGGGFKPSANLLKERWPEETILKGYAPPHERQPWLLRVCLIKASIVVNGREGYDARDEAEDETLPYKFPAGECREEPLSGSSDDDSGKQDDLMFNALAVTQDGPLE